jgi:hypothetical protein
MILVDMGNDLTVHPNHKEAYAVNHDGGGGDGGDVELGYWHAESS